MLFTQHQYPKTFSSRVRMNSSTQHTLATQTSSPTIINHFTIVRTKSIQTTHHNWFSTSHTVIPTPNLTITTLAALIFHYYNQNYTRHDYFTYVPRFTSQLCNPHKPPTTLDISTPNMIYYTYR